MNDSAGSTQSGPAVVAERQKRIRKRVGIFRLFGRVVFVFLASLGWAQSQGPLAPAGELCACPNRVKTAPVGPSPPDPLSVPAKPASPNTNYPPYTQTIEMASFRTRSLSAMCKNGQKRLQVKHSGSSVLAAWWAQGLCRRRPTHRDQFEGL